MTALSRQLLGDALRRSLLSLTIFLAGCASAVVTPEKAVKPVKETRPQMIVVRNFAVVAEDVKESHGLVSKTADAFSSNTPQQRQMDIGHKAAQELSDQLTKDLQKLGFTTLEQAGPEPISGDALLVEGQFVQIDEGAATRRIIVGFGVGKSTVDTQVQVYRVSGGSRQKLLQFTTHADSGKMPGTALTMGAGAVATGGATVVGGAVASGMAGGKAYNSAVNNLADETADQVSVYLSHYFAEQEWTTSE